MLHRNSANRKKLSTDAQTLDTEFGYESKTESTNFINNEYTKSQSHLILNPIHVVETYKSRHKLVAIQSITSRHSNESMPTLHTTIHQRITLTTCTKMNFEPKQ